MRPSPLIDAESAPARTRKVYWRAVLGDKWAWLCLAVCGLGGTGAGIYFAWGHGRGATVFLTVALAAAGLGVALLLIFGGLLLVTLRHQRDEARELVAELQAREGFPDVSIEAHPPLLIETADSSSFPGERESLFVIPVSVINRERDRRANFKFECYAEVPKPFPHKSSLHTSYRHEALSLPVPLKVEAQDTEDGDLYVIWSHALDFASFGRDVSETDVLKRLNLRLVANERFSKQSITVNVPGVWNA